MIDQEYAIELVVPPEKTIAETYEMLEQLYADEFIICPLSHFAFCADGMHLKMKCRKIKDRSFVESLENIGFVVNYGKMSTWMVED